MSGTARITPDKALQRARVNIAEARHAGAMDSDVFTSVVAALRGRNTPSEDDRQDARELLQLYTDFFATPGYRPQPAQPDWTGS